MQWRPPTVPGRKGRWWLVSFPSRDWSWPWERASCLLDTQPERDNQTGEKQDWTVARGALFQEATSAERQPSDLMEGFSFQILNVCIRGSSSGNCWQKIFHSALSYHVPSNCQLYFGQSRKFCEIIEITFVARSLFFIEWLNAQEMKLAGAGSLLNSDLMWLFTWLFQKLKETLVSKTGDGRSKMLLHILMKKNRYIPLARCVFFQSLALHHHRGYKQE